MATAPSVPNFAQFNFALGDTDAAITKQNGQNAALVNYGNALKTFGEAIEQEQAATLDAAEQTRQEAIQDTTQLKNETLALRDQSQQYAADALAERGLAETAAADAQASANTAAQIAMGDVIDDTATSPNLLWSSEKVSQELGNVGAILDSINGV